jgi:hypothetical protein
MRRISCLAEQLLDSQEELPTTKLPGLLVNHNVYVNSNAINIAQPMINVNLLHVSTQVWDYNINYNNSHGTNITKNS